MQGLWLLEVSFYIKFSSKCRRWEHPVLQRHTVWPLPLPPTVYQPEIVSCVVFFSENVMVTWAPHELARLNFCCLILKPSQSAAAPSLLCRPGHLTQPGVLFWTAWWCHLSWTQHTGGKINEGQKKMSWCKYTLNGFYIRNMNHWTLSEILSFSFCVSVNMKLLFYPGLVKLLHKLQLVICTVESKQRCTLIKMLQFSVKVSQTVLSKRFSHQGNSGITIWRKPFLSIYRTWFRKGELKKQKRMYINNTETDRLSFNEPKCK